MSRMVCTQYRVLAVALTKMRMSLFVLVGQREELGADARGDVLVDTIADDDDAVEEEGGGESHRAVGGVHPTGTTPSLSFSARIAGIARARRGLAAARREVARTLTGAIARGAPRWTRWPSRVRSFPDVHSCCSRPKTWRAIRRAANRTYARAGLRGSRYEPRGSNAVFARDAWSRV